MLDSLNWASGEFLLPGTDPGFYYEEAKSIIQSDHEWLFFSPTHKKYPSGSQARRATQAGFWKATGKECDIKSGNNVIGTKRTLVFYIGRSPKGTRTDWIIHEYYLKENQDDKCQASYVICRLRKKQDSVTTNPSSEAGSLMRLSPEPVILHAAAAPRVCNDLQQIKMGVCRNEEDGTMRSIEDDCFADILRDDIVKLDYNLFDEAPLLPNIAECSTVQNLAPAICSSESSLPHFQGIARKWIGLESDRVGRSLENMPRVGEKDSTEEQEEVEGHDPGNCVMSWLAKRINTSLRVHGWWISAVLVILLVFRFLFLRVL